MQGLVSWLSWWWVQCQKLKTNAKGQLEALGLNQDDLRTQWQEQVMCQMKPALHKSKSHATSNSLNIHFQPTGNFKRNGEKAIEEILELRKVIATLLEEEASIAERLL